MDIKFFFNESRGDIRPELMKALDECISFKLVTGFVTEAGISNFGPRTEIIDKCDLLVFGDANAKALQSMSALYDDFLKRGKTDIIKVHLGYGNRIYERSYLKQIYRPMMHSKVFLFHCNDGRFKAFIGSQNISGYSLRGLNSEAIVEISGQTTEKIYNDLMSEITSIAGEAKPFEKKFLFIYEAMHNNMIKGMLPVEDIVNREYVSLLFAFIDIEDKDKIKLNQTLYFETPDFTERRTKIETHADVWIIPIDTKSHLRASFNGEMIFFRARQTGANDPEGEFASYEKVDWIIKNYQNPIIEHHGLRNPRMEGGLQVLMKFEKDFSQTYPDKRYDQIQYTEPHRKVTYLTPQYSVSRDSYLNPFPRRDRIIRGEERAEEGEWVPIEAFKEMHVMDKEILPVLLSPKEVGNHLDSLREGITYRSKVRLNDDERG